MRALPIQIQHFWGQFNAVSIQQKCLTVICSHLLTVSSQASWSDLQQQASVSSRGAGLLYNQKEVGYPCNTHATISLMGILLYHHYCITRGSQLDKIVGEPPPTHTQPTQYLPVPWKLETVRHLFFCQYQFDFLMFCDIL